MHKTKDIIILTCDGVDCNSTVKDTGNYLRPDLWTFITWQSDKYPEPKELHFCHACSFKINFPKAKRGI